MRSMTAAGPLSELEKKEQRRLMPSALCLTVAPLNPLLSVYAAVTRRTLDNKNPNGWVPEQKITVEEALHAYTTGSAYAEFQENVKGTITPGKLADLVILSSDIFKIDPSEIERVKVLTTIMDGVIVFEAGNK